MAINIIEAAKVAKAKTTDKRWQNAIDKAVAGVTSGQWIVTELAHCVAVTTESEKTYRANTTVCQCEAFFRGTPCKHRALYRLLQIAETETAKPAVSPRVPTITRSIERRIEYTHTGAHYPVVRCDGWHI